MTPSTRRHVLFGASALAASGLAGCFDFGTTGHGGPWFELALDELGASLTESVAVAEAEQSARQREVLDAAVGDSEPTADSDATTDADASRATATTYGWRPFEDGSYVEHGDAYYRAEVTETDRTKSVRRPVLYARPVPESDAENPVEITAFPERDYTALKHALKLGRALGRQTTESDADADSATSDETTANAVPTEYVYVLHVASSENSGLLPRPDHRYVELHGEYYELVVETRTVDERAIRTRLGRVADAPAAFEAYAERNVVDGTLDRDELPKSAGDVVHTAIGDGYDEEVPLSDAYVAVLDQCGYDATSDGVSAGEDWNRTRYVRYDGRYYRATVMKAVV